MSEYIGYVEFNGQRLYPGSFVLLKNNRGKCWNADGLMDRYLNRVVCIKEFTGPKSFYIYQDIADNNYTWVFSIDDINFVCEVETKTTPNDSIDLLNFSTISMQGFKDWSQKFISELHKEEHSMKFPKIIKFINRPEDRTLVVFFDDGTKTVAKCDPADEFDLETGIEVCIMKKLFGNNYRSLIRKEIKSVALDLAEAEKIKRRAIEEKERIRKKKEKYHRKKLEAQARREVELENIKKKLKKSNYV